MERRLSFAVVCRSDGTLHTFPHIGAQEHVVWTSAGELCRALVDEGGREAQELTATVQAVTLAAPVCS